jgi:hypothetical protein
MKAPVNVGEFGADSRLKNTKKLSCRALRVEPPQGRTFVEYIRHAFIAELARAEKYSEAAPVTLSGQVHEISYGGSEWVIGMTLSSSNGKQITLKITHNTKGGFMADTACENAAKGFADIVQELVGKLVGNEEFSALLKEKSSDDQPSDADEAPAS